MMQHPCEYQPTSTADAVNHIFRTIQQQEWMVDTGRAQVSFIHGLTVLNADVNALSANQSVANLRMNRLDQQIALASALGGGFVDTSNANAGAAPRADASAPITPVVAAR